MTFFRFSPPWHPTLCRKYARVSEEENMPNVCDFVETEKPKTAGPEKSDSALQSAKCKDWGLFFTKVS
jgi:hypothetical protein